VTVPAVVPTAGQHASVSRSVHDRSAPPRILAAGSLHQAVESRPETVTRASAAAVPATRSVAAVPAAGGPVPDGGAVEQTSFGPRPPMPALTSFDRLGPDGNGRELHGDDRLG